MVGRQLYQHSHVRRGISFKGDNFGLIVSQLIIFIYKITDLNI